MTTPVGEQLSTLARALSPEAPGLVLDACNLEREMFNAPDSQIELIRHVRRQRATLLYSFEDEARAARRIMGKVYRSGNRAARIHRWLSALNNDVFPETGRLRVPSPLGRSEELHMLLYAHIDGVDLRHALDDATHLPFALAARWLARLHDAPALKELTSRTVEHQIEKSLRWLDTVQPGVGPKIQRELEHVRGRLSGLLAAPPTAELCIIHHDYWYGNLLWDGERIWAIDLDQLHIGDPALDVAHFLRHLQVLAYRQTGNFNAYDAQGEHFLTTYHNERPSAAIDGRLSLYRAYTFLKLAATETERQRDGWRTATEAFTQRACAEFHLLT